MRLGVLSLVVIFFLAFSNANAGTIYVADYDGGDYSIDISEEGGVCDALVCINVYKKLKNGEQVKKSFPFYNECYLTKNGKKIKPDGYGGEFYSGYDGFVCSTKGHTPLAGATYKLMQFGRSHNSCEEGIEPGNKLICVKGCGNSQVPELLFGHDGTC